jgi:hypothetical protein
MVGWSDLRTAARRTVHATFGEPFAYTVDGQTTMLVVRHRTRQSVHGGPDDEYATLLEGVNQLVFSVDDLAANSIVLKRGARVTLPPFLLELDQPVPRNGPVDVVWSVVDVTDAS